MEFCGGGEPLEHSSIDKLIELASEFRRNKRMDFGLLTNGQNISGLDESTVEIILESFAYIRLSYSERASADKKLREEYLCNLAKLIGYKNENNKLKATIGSKLLLTSKNKDQLLKTVFELLKLGVEHLKVKSIRSRDDEPSPEDLIQVEEELGSFKSEKTVKNVLKVDLGRTVFLHGFKCWINPLSVTIDPYGGIYICFNFHNDPENMMIGKYNENNSLSDFWGKSKHIEKILNINTKKVCKADNSCNCRYADYQKMMEEIFWKGLSTKYGEVNNESKSAIESKRIQKFL